MKGLCLSRAIQATGLSTDEDIRVLGGEVKTRPSQHEICNDCFGNLKHVAGPVNSGNGTNCEAAGLYPAGT